MTRLVRVARLAALLLVGAFAGTLAATRGGLLEPRPAGLAALGGAVLVAAAGAAALALAGLRRRREGRAALGAEAVLFVGLAVTAGAGLANWAFAIQGLVVLTEGEAIPLARGAHLQELSAGPMARLSEVDGVLRLVEVELEPVREGGFLPESRLEVMGAGEAVQELTVTPRRPAVAGALVLHQGAFGFAPRVVLQKDGVTRLDRVVPFTSRREGPRGVAFEAELELAGEGVLVVAAVDLGALDEEMKGHPVLAVELRRGGELLGQGRLLPGHGATMRDGWHIGYGGMKMWSEIDIRRRSSRLPALAGCALIALGGVAWPILRRRRP